MKVSWARVEGVVMEMIGFEIFFRVRVGLDNSI